MYAAKWMDSTMLSYKDTTYCNSPTCCNKCGKQLTDNVVQAAKVFGLGVAVAQFCDLDGEPTGLSGPGEYRKVDIQLMRPV